MTDITLDRYIILGTAAQRAAFVPDPGVAPAAEYLLPIWIESDTGDAYYWDNNTTAWVPWPTGPVVVPDGDYGDITVSGTGTVWTIDNSVVTLGKIANQADLTILGNNSGGAGPPIALTAAQTKTLLGATTVGNNLFTVTNPSAITFLRVNADNSVSLLDAATFRGAIGAGSGTGDLLASNNLSDVANAGTSRTNLGLAIGTNVQAFNARLSDIAGITYAQGDILYYNGTNLVKLSPGTNGYFLKTQGAGANPVWAVGGGGGTGDVVGPASSVANHVAIFDGTTGKLLKDAASPITTSNLTQATSKLLGRTTASTGAIEEITPRKGLAFASGNLDVVPRVSSNASSASPMAWNSDTYDQIELTALANALTINADSGTPAAGQKVIFRLKDNGSARALTWTTGSAGAFRAIGVTLPTTTVISKTVYVGCVYNATDSRWDAVAVAQET